MKRLLALLMATTLCISLCACGMEYDQAMMAQANQSNAGILNLL